MLCGQALGLRTCFTDHSLFGFNDMASLAINKVLKMCLANVDACITVSHGNKDNLTLRAAVHPS
jgi:phosphatidylinositol glycan class A protein